MYKEKTPYEVLVLAAFIHMKARTAKNIAHPNASMLIATRQAMIIATPSINMVMSLSLLLLIKEKVLLRHLGA